jgi:hypothetical protein
MANDKAKRLKLVKFDLPTDDVISKLVSDGVLERIDVPATEAKIGKNGKPRKGRAARVRFRAKNRAAGVSAFGGNEKAMIDCALEYRDQYFKRANSKGKSANPDIAINSAASALGKVVDTADLSPEDRAAFDRIMKLAASRPVVRKERKPRKAKTETPTA